MSNFNETVLTLIEHFGIDYDKSYADNDRVEIHTLRRGVVIKIKPFIELTGSSDGPTYTQRLQVTIDAHEGNYWRESIYGADDGADDIAKLHAFFINEIRSARLARCDAMCAEFRELSSQTMKGLKNA